MKKKYFYLLISALATFQLNSQTIKINDSIVYQEMVGFGFHGGMNVWWGAGPFYDNAYLDNVIDDLGMTVNRNNFHAYDMPVYHNKQKTYYTALNNKAIASNEPLFIINSVWSPPIEWKANNLECDEVCTSACGNNKDLSPTCNSVKNYLLPAHYTDYANFCADYIKDLLEPETGVRLYAFSLQNEPAFNEPYESCVYSPQQYNALLKIAAPIFKVKCPYVKFFGPEDMGSAGATSKWTTVIFNDTTSVKCLDILAVHSYTDGINPSSGDADGWSKMYEIASGKNKQLWMTETDGYTSGWNDAHGPYKAIKEIYLGLKFGKISAWTFFYVFYGSAAATMKTDRLYNAYKSYTRYIRPGAVQTDSYSPTTDVSVVAFKNSGNSAYSAVKPQFTVILINNATSTKTVNLTGRSMPGTMKAYRTSATENCLALADANTASISLPASSITTLVYIGTNKSPTINQPNNIVVLKNQVNRTVSLSNVTAGSGETGAVTVTAVSNNKTLIPGAIIVSGSSPNYTLTFSTAAEQTGTATITIYVKDAGTDILNTTVVKFNIKVIAVVNAAPTIDAIKNYTVGLNNKSKKHYIWFSGVTDGNGGSQIISKPILTLSDPDYIRLPYVNYTPNNSYGYIEFYPDKLGTTSVEVKLQDNGGTDLGGADTKTINFAITVVADAPLLGEKENNEQQLTVYPNPANDIINVILPDDSYSVLNIIDMAGVVVHTSKILSITSEIRVDQLNNGIYTVVASGNNGSLKSKLSIIK